MYKQRQRTAALADGVSSVKARRHLERVEATLLATSARGDSSRRKSGIGRSLIAATAGVPLAVVRAVVTGSAVVLTREHQTRLLAVTVAACLSNVRANGPRGRLTQAGSRPVPVGPTLERIRELEEQGFNRGWVGRELGYAVGIQVAGPNCTEAMERKIADLHRRVGDLRAPRLPSNQRIPPLAELKSAAEVRGPAGRLARLHTTT